MKTLTRFEERILDDKKTMLAPSFIKFIKESAPLNGKTEDELWDLWQEYSKTCLYSDQSALIWEFCEWYKIKNVTESEN